MGVARAGQYLPVSHSGQCRHLLAVAWKTERGGGGGEKRGWYFIFNHAERSRVSSSPVKCVWWPLDRSSTTTIHPLLYANRPECKREID